MMDEPHTTPLLELTDVCKDFKITGDKNLHRAVNHVNQTIGQGEALALVGESGSGKSTLARLIMGLHSLNKGTIKFAGTPLTEFTGRRASLDFRRQVQLLFQDPFSSLNPTKTIYYHLARAVVLHQSPTGKRDVQEKVEAALNRVELQPAQDFAKRYPYQLSGGQRQRVNIARVLAVGARLVLADEPTSMLDVSIRIGILNLLAEFKRENGISLLYITHDIASARYLADKVAVIYRGHILEWGDTEKVIQSPRHPYTQLLVAATPDATVPIMDALPGKQNTEAPLWSPNSKGCPFAHRCLHASDACKWELPQDKEVGEGQFVRCQLY